MIWKVLGLGLMRLGLRVGIRVMSISKRPNTTLHRKMMNVHDTHQTQVNYRGSICHSEIKSLYHLTPPPA
jgi:hypothetical protein